MERRPMIEPLSESRFAVVRNCPQCGARPDAALGAPGTAPRRRDLSVCGHCATPLQFTDDDAAVARLTPHEIAALPPRLRRQLLHMMDVIRSVQHHLRKARRS